MSGDELRATWLRGEGALSEAELIEAHGLDPDYLDYSENTRAWLREHRDTNGKHYGMTGPGSSASLECPRCGGGKR